MKNKTQITADRMFIFGLVMLASSVAFSIAIMNTVFIFLFAAFVIKFMQGEIRYISTGLEKPLFLFMAFYLLSALLSPHPKMSVTYAIDNFWHILYMYAVIYLFTGDDIRRFVKIMAWSAVAVSVYSLFQSLLGLHTSITLRLPDKTYMVVRPKDEIVFHLFDWPVRMGTGITGLHLTYGGQIMMMSFFVWAALRKKWALALTVISIFLSFAYSAWLGFIGAVFLFYGFRKKTAPFAAALLILFFSILFAVPGNRDEVMDKLEDRIRIWRISLEMYSERPLVGIGPKGFRDIYRQRYLPKYPGARLGHAHSIYLDILTEGGIPTALAFIYFIFSFVKRYGKRVKGEFRDIHTACNLALIGIMIAGLFQNYHTAAENSVLIWILLGITVKINLLSKSDSIE